MTAYRLDVPELHRRLDAQRIARGLSWRAVGRESGVGANVVHRITQGHRPDADALVSLLVWLDLDTDIAYLIRPKEIPDA